MEDTSQYLMPALSSFDPAYVQDASEGRRATNTICSLTSGTGYTIYKSTIIPAIKNAEREVILVTCFWAASATRDLVNEALRHLSNKALSASTRISVRICFSSSSLARNMLLPTPKEGQHYPSSSWKKLGLPEPEQLKGLNLTITRKFFWPFGIIHSKYVVVDGDFAIFPSCNVSWERWFEAAVTIRGPVVEQLLAFHNGFWEGRRPSPDPDRLTHHGSTNPGDNQINPTVNVEAPTTLLPSPHTPTLLPNHIQPRALIGHCPCMPDAPAAFAQTPLLKTTYHLLSTAKSSITILTPNLTEPTVLELLFYALVRGVHVHIWTNRNLMTLEQLATAGTTTPACVESLRRRVLETETRGHLEVSFFDADDGPGSQHPVLREIDEYRETVPVKLHAKVTIIDRERILLGSGNMDAASWKTSQELGLLIESPAVVAEFTKLWKYDKFGA